MQPWFLSRKIWSNLLAGGLGKASALSCAFSEACSSVLKPSTCLPPRRARIWAMGLTKGSGFTLLMWIWMYSRSRKEVRGCSWGPFRGPFLGWCYMWLYVFPEPWPVQTGPRWWDQMDCWNLSLSQWNNIIASIYRLQSLSFVFKVLTFS